MVRGQTPVPPASIPSPTPQAAVNVVTSDFTPNPLVRVPATGKPLPTTGSWGALMQVSDKDAPEKCRGGGEPCMKVLYHVPEAGLECSWIVGFAADPKSGGVSPEILEEDDNAATYTMRKAWEVGEKPPVPKEQYLPVYPPRANATQLQGDVVVRVVVDSNGKTTSAAGISGPTLLALISDVAAHQWKFRPYCVGIGPATAFSKDLRFHFVADGNGGYVASPDVIDGVPVRPYPPPIHTNNGAPRISRNPGEMRCGDAGCTPF